MSILQVLSKLEHPAYIKIGGEVWIPVGQSDRDAAVALLDVLDKIPDDMPYKDLEARVFGNLLLAMKDLADRQPEVTYADFMEDRRSRAMLDSLWWLRFLSAIKQAEEWMAEHPEEAGAGPLPAMEAADA